MAEMTDEARVVALDRLWPGDIADRSGELLDVVSLYIAARVILTVNRELTFALRQPRVDACRNHP